MDHLRKRWPRGSELLAALAFSALPLMAAPALAQDFYAGKQVSMIVGSGTGGGYPTNSPIAQNWLFLGPKPYTLSAADYD